MKSNNKSWMLIGALAVVVLACAKPDDLEEKRKQLVELKSQVNDLKTKIATLEDEIAEEDPAFARENKKATLITSLPVEKRDFEHFVEVSGNVESRRNILISAETMGTVARIPVQEGDFVTKGTLLISLDADILQNNIAEVKTQLDLAKTIFERQANLWDQKIGTEIQYLQAKNNKESLKRRLATLQSQLDKSRVYAPFDGNVEKINVKLGETAQPGFPLLRIVSQKDMYIKADLSEAFIGKFKKGDKVLVDFPSLGKQIATTISAVGEVINPANRTFSLEVRIPQGDAMLKPNMQAVLKVKDFEQKDAIAIPVNLIQRDNKGEFVYTVVQSGEILIAKKIHIERGLTYEGKSLVVEGLQAGNVLVNEGFREVIDGATVKEAELN